ncbi:hypothetical protein GS610_19920 [Ruegeria sp. HKCCD6228]|uniref:hypothetical protein n=1 Tax=unclassified Ruegeria TaxID=2625375 RepID=UPI00148A0874|nr:MULTISPECIES: hypothetical protein [unclassified Ruegeria]NOD99482.1 hypothetical protein [Ruegeria sp. HKCCD6228]
MFEILLRGISVVLLLFLPGAWIAFSRLLRNVDIWDRFGVSFALSIPMSCAQYLALAYAGMGTGTIPWAILTINLGSIWFIMRSWQWVPLQNYRLIIPSTLVLPLIVLVVHANAPYVYQWSHTFLHADLIYALIENPTAPEEWQLAGLGTGYPWFGHLQRVLLGQVLDQSPINAYLWINPAMAFGFGVLSILVVRSVGGGPVAMLLAPILAALSTNPIGVLGRAISSSLWNGAERYHHFIGDARYDATGLKFLFLNTNQLGLILMLAMLLTILRSATNSSPKTAIPLWILFLVGIGLVYPLYLPAAATFLGAAGIMWVLDQTQTMKSRLKNVSLLYASVLLGTACTYFLVTAQTSDRVAGAGIELHVPGQIWRHGVAAATGLLIPVAAWVFALMNRGIMPREQLTFLTLAAFAAGSMAVLLHVPNFRNEYKYVMVASLCGLPFVALWSEYLWRKSKRPWALGALLLLIVAGGFATAYPRTKMYEPPFQVTFSGEDQRLTDAEGLGDALAVIRDRTEPGIPTLVAATPLHITPFTRRPVYILYDDDTYLTGLGMKTGYLLQDVKGFDPALLTSRQNRLDAFFNSEVSQDREQAYSLIRSELGEPFTVLSDNVHQPALLSWMDSRGAELLHAGQRYSVWYLE